MVPIAWVQYVADGHPHVRAIAQDRCPTIVVDGKPQTMRVRFAAGTDFPNLSCDLDLHGARSASLDGKALPLLHHAPRKIAVIGDTGCRLKGTEVQACNDTQSWPFATVASDIARERPDLIIHVGDYYYRETACPPFSRGCEGSPYGDAWPAWNADWFTPAQPLFDVAPLVLVRGNHEDCSRGGHGWVHYLEPHELTACSDLTPPYLVNLGDLRLAVFDSSKTSEVRSDVAEVAAYGAQMWAASGFVSGETWFLTHKPVYGALELAGFVVFTNDTLERAAGTALQPFSAILSGHIHTFQAISFDGLPPQIVNGISGDNLDDKLRANLVGRTVQGHAVTAAFTDTRFGYGIYELTAPRTWSLSIRDVAGKERVRCSLGAGKVRCAQSVGP